MIQDPSYIFLKNLNKFFKYFFLIFNVKITDINQPAIYLFKLNLLTIAIKVNFQNKPADF